MKLIKRILGFIVGAGIGYGIFRLFKKIQEMRQTNQSLTVFKGDIDKYEEDDLFDGGSYASIFGAVKVDLSEAVITDDVAILELEGLFSAIKIIVPPSWKVKMDGTSHQSQIKTCEAVDQGIHQPVLIVKHKLFYSALKIETAVDDVAETNETDISEHDEGTIIDEVI